jgi:hypothetical protein
MPGFMQFLTGLYLLTGLTSSNVFGKAAPLYMAGLPFTAYGIWLVRDVLPAIYRFQRPAGWFDGDSLPVSQHPRSRRFSAYRDNPVMLIFVGLTLIYAIEIPARLLSWTPGGLLVGLFQFITGVWLMYCTYAMTVDLAVGAKAWV